MMTAFDRAWDLVKAPTIIDNRTSHDFDFIDMDEGDDECCSQFRPALERYHFFKGKWDGTPLTCSELYDRLTEIIDMMYSRPDLIPGNPDWVKVLPEIKRQWDECRAKNHGLEGME